MNDPDAIWKPGYDGPPPVVEPADEPTDEPADEPNGDGSADTPVTRSRRRWFGIRSVGGVGVGVGVGVGLALVGAVLVFDPLGSRDVPTADDPGAADSGVADSSAGAPVIERPDPSVFGGDAAGRLPDDAAMLWSVDFAHDGEHWVEVIRRELVIAAFVEPGSAAGDVDDAVEPTVTVVALDAPTGEQRWTRRLDGHPGEVSVVGAVGDVLVLEQPGVEGPNVLGVDVATGEVRWSSDAVANDGHVGLAGTAFIARLPASPDDAVSLIDATSGAEVGTIASDPTAAGRPPGWSTNGRGTWYVADDGMVVEYDLRTALGEATVIAREVDVSTAQLVVDGRLAVVDDSGSLTFAGGDADRPVTVSAEVPAFGRALTPVSDSAFVVAAPGTISGVAVEGDDANVTWLRRDGVIVEHHPVVGGSLIQVATRGGAAMELVDGSSGETVEHLTMRPGALQALVVAGDGAVLLRASALGGRLAGIDLDGTERWSILGSAPVLVGDRIVVRATSSGGVDENSTSMQLRITGYGDID